MEIFICHRGRTATDKCIKDFEDQEGFTFVDVEPDGNCFFHTLALYYGFQHANQSTHYEELHTTLRQRVVEYMLTHYEHYAPFGLTIEEIEEMGEDGVWNSNAGDLMPPAAAAALNLPIQLYDIVPGTRTPYTKKRILLHRYPEEGRIPDNKISVLRMNKGHYGLLLPSSQKKTAEANTNALAASLASLSVTSPPKKSTKKRSKTKK